MRTHIALILVLLLLTACAQQKQEPVKIGQLAALTSFGAEWGASERDGVALAVKEANEQGGINGAPIKIILEDTESDFTKTLSAYTKLRNVDDVNIIIGPTWNEFTQVVLPKAKEDGVLLMGPSTSFDKSPIVSPLFFSTFHSTRWINEPVINDMKKKGYKRVIVLHDQNEFTQFAFDFFVEDAKRNGIEIIDDVATNPDTKEYRTEITKIKGRNPDAVYLLLSFWPNHGEFLKQADAAKLDVPIYVTLDVQNERFMETYGKFADGVMYSWPEDGPHQQEFIEKYSKEYGHGPVAPSAMSSYDAANLIIAAMRAGAKTPQEISAYLKNVKEYPGAISKITFDKYGQVAYHPYYLKVVHDGNATRV
jgi:branched-chain amino acid transport system substrate-binding protein